MDINHLLMLDFCINDLSDSLRDNTFSSAFAYNLPACRTIPMPVKLCADVFEQIKNKFIDNTNELSFCNFLNTKIQRKKIGSL